MDRPTVKMPHANRFRLLFQSIGLFGAKRRPEQVVDGPANGKVEAEPARLALPADAPPPLEHQLPSGDPDVSTAFVLGWELGSLLRNAPFDEPPIVAGPTKLLRLDALSSSMRAKLAVELVDSNLQKLDRRLANSKRIDPRRIPALRLAIQRRQEVLEEAINELHLEALFALASADAKLSRAYALGYELADICLEPSDRRSFEDAFGTQAVAAKDRLADLASSFPPHASRAVVLSLRAWEEWAAEPKLNGKRLNWSSDGAGVKSALRRQGVLWRDLLAGDKQGQDMLDTSHYIQAASSLIASTVSTIKGFMRPLRWLLLLLLACLFGGLILFFVFGAKVFGSILAALGAIGITSAGIRARLGDVTGHLQSQLWGAELDRAIAEAVLTGPDGWDAKVEDVHVPASGAPPKTAANLETLREFRDGVRSGSKRRIARLLAPEAEFVVPGGRPVRGQKSVAEWLLKEPQATRIGTEPGSVVGVKPGVLVSSLDGGAAVWRVREGKVRWRKGFATVSEALQEARLSWSPREGNDTSTAASNGEAPTPAVD
jgi:hypothetical protein